MASIAASWRRVFLGDEPRQRTRVSQMLLGTLPLTMIHALLALQWRQGQLGGAALAWYIGLSWAGCVQFYLLARFGFGERFSREPSLSAPQMAFAMVCTAWAYGLAGPLRAALLPLLPLILCFGIFALNRRAARALSHFGIALIGGVMAGLTWMDATAYPPLEEAANWGFVAATMAMIRVLADRLGNMRKRLSAQKEELEQALAHIQHLATRDVLTGLMNRRAAQEELHKAAVVAQRHNRALTVAMVDLDHFKRINDNYGHQAGDRVLQAFAQVAQAELRGSDRVVRWGGEEFLIFLPETDELQAVTCLERIRSAYATQEVYGLPAGYRLSFSAGVAPCRDTGDIDTSIERADGALYQAKQAGRARTRMASTPLATPASPTEPATFEPV